jgi:uncharacterized protein (DUF1778 family)
MKMGRPQIAPSERKQTIITLRVNDSERGELEQAASSKGASFSSWARETLLQEARQIRDQAGR